MGCECAWTTWPSYGSIPVCIVSSVQQSCQRSSGGAALARLSQPPVLCRSFRVLQVCVLALVRFSKRACVEAFPVCECFCRPASACLRLNGLAGACGHGAGGRAPGKVLGADGACQPLLVLASCAKCAARPGRAQTRKLVGGPGKIPASRRGISVKVRLKPEAQRLGCDTPRRNALCIRMELPAEDSSVGSLRGLQGEASCEIG